MANDDYSEAALVPTLGMYALPYASTWPELSDQLARMYQDRARDIAWLPSDWLELVLGLHGRNSEVLIPAPSNTSGVGAISFLKTPEQKAWWDDFAHRAEVIVSNYAAGQAALGRQQLDQLYADAAFWNTGVGASLIGFQQAAYSVADAAKAIASNPFKSIATVAGLGIGILLLMSYIKRK